MESEIQYKRLRNLPIRKSEKYLKWLKKRNPELQRHHLIGSQTGIKLNDYLILLVTQEQHLEAEKHKIDFAIENLPQSLNLLFEYIKYLEEK